MPRDPVHGASPPLRPGWRDTPHVRRLGREHARRSEILVLHAEAVEAGRPTYPDPISGFSVFTADFLARRGYCCGSGCRHCPFVLD